MKKTKSVYNIGKRGFLMDEPGTNTKRSIPNTGYLIQNIEGGLIQSSNLHNPNIVENQTSLNLIYPF